MGKRELLIVGAFVLLGAITYQLTAPPPREGTHRCSWSAVTDAWRRQTSGARGRAEVTTTGSIPFAAAASELNVGGATRVIVIGETRSSVAWTLLVQASGPDDDAAQRVAGGTSVKSDDLGPVLAIGVTTPAGVRPAATLTLRVPARAALRVEGALQTTVQGVASFRLENLMGDTNVTAIAGAVTGSHRNGTLNLSDVAAVTLSTMGTIATVSRVRGETALTVRNGACRVLDTTGGVTIDSNAASVIVEQSHGVVRLGGNGGMFTVTHPRGDVRIDAHTARVTVTLDAAIPVTVTTTEAATRLILDGNVPIDLDAATEQGSINASAFGLTPEMHDRDARLRHAFGDRARVTLRNTRGEIEIATGK